MDKRPIGPRALWSVFAATTMMLAGGSPLLGAPQPPAALHRPHATEATDGLLVRFAAGTGQHAARQAAAQVGFAPGEWIAHQGVLVVRSLSAPTTASMATLAALPEVGALAARHEVEHIEANPIIAVQDTPNDPYYATNQWAPQVIGMPAAWDVTTGSPSVVVAVVDTGLDMSHSEFAGKYAAGIDFVNGDVDPTDDHGHGTHIAGTVGALTNNGDGIAAIGRDTTILPVKVMNANGSGSHSTIAQGIHWATDNGADIINLSLSGSASTLVLETAVDYAFDHGVLVVAAAGNGNTSTPNYPAAYANAMAIAATTSTDARWSLSNFGPWISMAAPGSSIVSTGWSGGPGPYTSGSGTSQATAHVSAVAALLLAADPSQANTALRERLESSAVDLGTPGRDDEFGTGRLDALAAITLPPPPPPPSSATDVPPATPLPIATPTPVLITDIDASDIARTSATINWTTSAPATSQVEYGPNKRFGMLTPLDADMVTAHAVTLTGLARNKVYHFRVRSIDASGAETISPKKTFKTNR